MPYEEKHPLKRRQLNSNINCGRGIETRATVTSHKPMILVEPNHNQITTNVNNVIEIPCHRDEPIS